MSHPTTLVSACLISLSVVIGAAMLSHAGPLDPPAGPVTPTYKTLTEVEPRIAINTSNTPGDAFCLYKITKPGSYYLTGNIVGFGGGVDGIAVEASGVTIDLNGFVLYGTGAFASGIASTGSDITIRNGTIEDWFGPGVSLKDNSNLSNLTISDCSPGIRVDSDFVIEDCTISEINGISGSGIQANCCGVIHNCHIGGSGTNSSGISALSSVTITGCTVTDCRSHGIAVLGNAVVSDCLVADCDVGIGCGSASSISSCAIKNCTNGGLSVGSTCIVTGNSCDGESAGNGIKVTGTDTRIERNNISRFATGILVSGSGNIILGNTASGSATNYNIAANNRYGPIIDLTAGGSPAASGNSAPGTVVSTDPWANFAY